MFYTSINIALGVKDVDTVYVFHNSHNFDGASRAALYNLVFKPLSPGGIYDLVDHTRRDTPGYKLVDIPTCATLSTLAPRAKGRPYSQK